MDSEDNLCQRPGAAAQPLPIAPHASLNILIIDDDPFMRSFIGRMLRKLEVGQYQEAVNGTEGLRVIDNALVPFDLVICDIEMPDSDGMVFMRRMAERKFATPLMVLSGKPVAMLRSVQIMAKEYGLTVLESAQKPPSIALIDEVLSRCRPIEEPNRPLSRFEYLPEEILAALERQEFEPFFQPKVEIPTRRLCGCEALARWRHPTHGIITPGAFIGVIEKEKRMGQFTWLMLEKAVSWCRRWHDTGLVLSVNINLSPSLLSDTTVADRIHDIVRAGRVAPEHFILEVTETVALTDVSHCLESLCRLRLKGFGLSIDDFGTGFSSLQQLARVPFTELKVDQEFVRGAATSEQHRAVLESSIDIAKKLGITSVAEGVETEKDWQCVQNLGCDMAQGYYIAKPMNGEEFTSRACSWLSER